MLDKCPNCGEVLTKSERMKKYYCTSCGYQIKFDEAKTLEEVDEKDEAQENDTFYSEPVNYNSEYNMSCSYCGGEYVYDNGDIYCSECGKYPLRTENNTMEKKPKMKKIKIMREGFYCLRCGEKYSVVDGNIFCKTCDKDIVEDEELKKDKKVDVVCPKCGGEYYFDEETGKIACKSCNYQPSIENKDYIIDEDNSEIMAVECGKCGSNSGYRFIEDKVVCKSCGAEIERKEFEKAKHKKALHNDGVIAKKLSKKTVNCKNCGYGVEGFDFYKTEFCPKCGTINVVIEDLESLRLEPNKIIPYELSEQEAKKVLETYGIQNNLRMKLTDSLKKIYIPFWEFNFEKAKVYYNKKYNYTDENGKRKTIMLEAGTEEVDLSNVWILGKDEIRNEIKFDMNKIDMSKAVDYTPELLDVLTERYNVGTTEAEVIAGDILYDYIYDVIWKKKKMEGGVFFNSLDVDYKTKKTEFQQVLIPTWQGICKINSEQYFFMINGQTSEIEIAGFGKKNNLKKLVEGVLDMFSL